MMIEQFDPTKGDGIALYQCEGTLLVLIATEGSRIMIGETYEVSFDDQITLDNDEGLYYIKAMDGGGIYATEAICVIRDEAPNVI
jgi:hypothetical protein